MVESVMRIDSCELFFLEIPLRVSFSHAAKAGRMSSDSVVVKLRSADKCGYGEAVVRDYVSGSPETGRNPQQEAARAVSRLVAPLKGRFLSWIERKRYLTELGVDSRDLPFLCAVETALIDLECKWAGADVYSVLDQAPRRETVRYGGVLPFFPLAEAEKYLRFCRQLGLPDIKVKLNGNRDFDFEILELCRGILGKEFDVRVDSNSSWSVQDGEKLFEVCARHGVSFVEQPFADSATGASECMRDARAAGFSIMADERVLSSRDIQTLVEAQTYNAVNLRLSKNGGLLRLLRLCDEAVRGGLSYQLGCMVGETGILSALGRAAAALLPAPLFVEGSYDNILLTENITAQSLGFGQGGEAPVIRGQGAGFVVVPEKLARFSTARVVCR
jgi:muconate cycloisomerase